MRQTEITSGVCVCVTCLCMAIAATSCGKGNYAEKKDGGVNDGGAKTTNAVVAIESSNRLTQAERLEVESRRLVGGAGRIKRRIWSVSCDLCKEICKLPKEEALPLLDRLIEMAIEQPVTNANRSAILGKHEDLFQIVLCSFTASQGLRANSPKEWDKVFRFFKKYTDEITAEGKRIKELDRQQVNPYYKHQHDGYLHLLQVYTENWVHNARTVFLNWLSKGLTEKQKADILRRLDEVKKYTVPPPHSPFNKMIPTQGGNDK